MDEGYLRPEHFVFSTAIGVLTSLVINAAMRPAVTEGRYTMVNSHDIGERRMVPQEIVGYSANEFANALELMESSIDFGEKARITFCTEALPTQEDLEGIYLGMIAEGCHVSYPTALVIEGIPTTEFTIRKGSPAWGVAIIGILVPIFIIGLIAFGIFRLEAITKALVPLLLITFGGLIILAIALRKPAEKYLERGGKVPYLPSTKNPTELEQKVKGLWAKACEWERIPPDSKFVVFSDDNPYLEKYNEAVGQLLRLKQFKAGEWKPAVTKTKKALAAR